MRDRLIEILEQMSCLYYDDCDQQDCVECGRMEIYDSDIKKIANHLIANGVIVPPCKVGDIVYINGCFGGVAEPHKIKFMSFQNINGATTKWFFEADLLDDKGNLTGSDCGFWEQYIGVTVFLTREEAEQALKRKEDDGK